MIGSPAFTLVLVSAFFAVINLTMQVVLTDRKAMRKTQKEMKEKQKKMQELMKQGDANKAEIQNVQNEMLELSTRNMKNLPKMLVANMVVMLPLFWMVSNAYHGVKIILPFPLSFVAAEGDWFWVYVLCSLIISTFANQILTKYEIKHETKHAQTPVQPKTN